MFHEEMTGRNQRRQIRLYQESGLRNNRATGESLIFDKGRNLNQGLVEELLTCRWIKSDNPPNVVVTGAAGTGKTYLVEKGISVSYWHFPQLLEKMTEAFNRNESSALRRTINCKGLLIIVTSRCPHFAMSSLAMPSFRDGFDWMRTDLLSLIDDRLQANYLLGRMM